jgi:hypothetical protein
LALPMPIDGRITLADAAGIGVPPDLQALSRYAAG